MTRRRPLPEVVRERILARWKETGISRAELSRRMGKDNDQSPLNQLERGSSPTLQRLELYSQALGVPVSYFIHEDEPPPELSPRESRLVDLYRRVGEDDRARLDTFAEALACVATMPTHDEGELLDWYRRLPGGELRERARRALEAIVRTRS